MEEDMHIHREYQAWDTKSSKCFLENDTLSHSLKEKSYSDTEVNYCKCTVSKQKRVSSLHETVMQVNMWLGRPELRRHPILRKQIVNKQRAGQRADWIHIRNDAPHSKELQYCHSSPTGSTNVLKCVQQTHLGLINQNQKGNSSTGRPEVIKQHFLKNESLNSAYPITKAQIL